MTEFSVLAEFRRKGMGIIIAADLIKMHPGKWNIEYDTNNKAGNLFWNKLVFNLVENNFQKGQAGENREYLEFVIAGK
jgi:predicted acetyltransferase